MAKLIDSPLCPLRKTENEPTFYVFHTCTLSHQLWQQLYLFLEPYFTFPELIPQVKPNSQNFQLCNNILLISTCL